MMAELMGRATGVCKGKGGSMHLSDPSVGLVSTNAIVAGHIPMAGGAALSCQFRRTGQVVLCFFGDGASCEGEFFEAMNMAMLWKVPLVFVCENNGIAISVPTSKSQATPDIADRARGFGMPASIVDGNDVLAVRAAVAEGVARARAGEGPTFVECKTVRWERHSAFSAGGSDPAEQRRAWQRVDPIPRFRKALVSWGLATDAELDDLDGGHPRRDALGTRGGGTRSLPGARLDLRGHLCAVAPVVAGRCGVSSREPRSLARATPGEHAPGRRARRRRDVVGVPGALRSPGRQSGDEREGDACRRRARLPAGHPRAEPAPAGDPQRRLRGRGHLEPADRRDRDRRRVDAPHERVLAAPDQLARRPAPRGGPHRAALAAPRRRARDLRARRDASGAARKAPRPRDPRRRARSQPAFRDPGQSGALRSPQRDEGGGTPPARAGPPDDRPHLRRRGAARARATFRAGGRLRGVRAAADVHGRRERVLRRARCGSDAAPARSPRARRRRSSPVATS